MMLAVRRKKPKYRLPGSAFGNSQTSKNGRDILDLVVEATRNLPVWNGKDLKENKAATEAVENGCDPICVKEDDVVSAPETLTEEDTQDIVRRVRELLRKQGPSQESELLAVLRPQQVQRLRASFDSLAALVERLPGFHHVCEDRYSFLYYLSPEEDDCCWDEGLLPPPERAELECDVKERAREVAQLEQRLEAVRLDQARKREALRFKIEQHRILQVTLPPMPTFCEGDDNEGGQKKSSSVGEEEGGEQVPLHAEPPLHDDDHDPEAEEDTKEEEEDEPPIDPGPQRATPAAALVEGENEMLGVRSPVPDFYDLHLQLERSLSSSDTESLWSSWGSGHSPGRRANKAEAQIAKIVKMLIKKEPNYTEAEMRRWVDEVRRLQGGFSRLTFNAIVAMVLDHMKKSHCLRRHANNKR
ncbi:uncharacterized protein LOC144165232 isoform X2 [Haemaphysalis longicornis]